MRHTEFCRGSTRCSAAAYSRSWAELTVLRDLDGRTTQEALDAGMAPKQVWRPSVGSWSCRRASGDEPVPTRRSRPRPRGRPAPHGSHAARLAGGRRCRRDDRRHHVLAARPRHHRQRPMAGLAQTFQVLGTAAAAYGLARVMGRRGRRVGLVTGYLLGASGAVLAVVAGRRLDARPAAGSPPLGATTAAQQRLALRRDRPRDRGAPRAGASLVVWASTIGAVAGPNLVGVGGSVGLSLGIPALTGGFAIGAVVLVVAAGWVWWRLRPDPLLVAQAAAGVTPSVGPEARGRSWATFVEVVRDVPAVGAAVVAMACAHAAMVTVMIMTPLHMEHGGADSRSSASSSRSTWPACSPSRRSSGGPPTGSAAPPCW